MDCLCQIIYSTASKIANAGIPCPLCGRKVVKAQDEETVVNTFMTYAERQALREKHSKDDWDCCVYCREWVGDDEATTIEVFYPCDVIKLLDATEPVSETDPKLLDPPTSGTSEPLDPLPVQTLTGSKAEAKPTECDHIEVMWVADNHIQTLTETACTYCPKCGEKL